VKQPFLSIKPAEIKAARTGFLAVVAATLLLMGAPRTGFAGDPLTNPPLKAVAVLHPTEGNTARGIVELQRSGSGTTITIRMEGLSPGKHGFHIHQYGDCSSLDGKSAGGHYNPEEARHGGPADKDRHVGDLGNILAGLDGKAVVEILDQRVALDGPHSVIGRAIVVHGGADDLSSQPAGAAGARVACGVIGITGM
jgi:Cu-Zn family superoxide dismutase